VCINATADAYVNLIHALKKGLTESDIKSSRGTVPTIPATPPPLTSAEDRVNYRKSKSLGKALASQYFDFSDARKDSKGPFTPPSANPPPPGDNMKQLLNMKVAV
jgi:hypothetical protein